jgi:hypothetical protein
MLFRCMGKAALIVAIVVAGTTLAVSRNASAAEEESRRGWAESKPGYAQFFATSFLGDGLRFNNPYRLATPLGSSAESLSRTAAYGDLGLASTTGKPLGLQHGVALRWSFALEGVRQGVLTPSYLLYRRWTRWAAYGRVGTALVLTPDTTWGLEAAAGGAWFARGGIGLAAELVGDVFYGAGTREVATPAYPVLSVQAGILLAWELLP